MAIAPTAPTAPAPTVEIHPERTLWLLSIAHAVNHAQAVILPLVYLQILREFHHRRRRHRGPRRRRRGSPAG